MLVRRSTTLSTTDEMTASDFEITAAIILIITSTYMSENIKHQRKANTKISLFNIQYL